MTEESVIYFRFKSGRSYQITREEWEQDWSDWWTRSNNA